MLTTIFNQKGFWIIVAIFLATVFLAINDPLGLNKGGIEGTSLLPILYVVPGILAWYLTIVLPTKDK